MKTASFLLAVAILLISYAASARTWYVTPEGTGDAPTIQAGIDSASAGDEVVLADGTFTGPGNRDIEYFGKAITVRSESGDPDLCIVDCEESGRGFMFQDFEGPESVLEGITITRGYNLSYGGAIFIQGQTGPTIRNCAFVSNSAGYWGQVQGNGGAIGCDAFYTDLRITGCTFVGNTAYGWGGAAYFYGQWFGDIVDSCLFMENSAALGGAVATETGHNIGDFSHCTFIENSALNAGGAAYTGNGGMAFFHCAFVKNSAPEGSAVYGDGGSHGTVYVGMYECIVAYGTGGCAVYSGMNYGWPEVDLGCCDIWGNTGGNWVGVIQDELGTDGNFSACPAFCNVEFAPYDLRLCDESPCLPHRGLGRGLRVWSDLS